MPGAALPQEGVKHGGHMGAKRLRKNIGLPPNLYPNGKYFLYVHPVTGKRNSWNCPKDDAIANAHKANGDIALQVRGLLDFASSAVAAPTRKEDSKTVAESIASYKEKDVPAKNWGSKTANEKRIKFEKIGKMIGAKSIRTFSVTDAGEFLDACTESPRNRQQFREVLSDICARAVANGWAATNVAEVTIVHGAEKARDILTLEGFRAIYAEAPQFLQNTMDLGLQTLLRRTDLASSRFSDLNGTHLIVIPKKTKSTTFVGLDMELSDEVMKLIGRCRDEILSPYIIHRLPDSRKGRDQRAEARDHLTQVLPEQITRAFQEARRAAKNPDGSLMYAENADGTLVRDSSKRPPSFHEVRGLGIHLYDKVGAAPPAVTLIAKEDKEQTGASLLAGHDKEGTTDIYRRGRGPRMVSVVAGLKALGVDAD